MPTEPRRAALARHLAEFDESCPSCGYSLRALTGDRCPECNQGLVLRVGLAEPRLGAFIAGLVGVGMGLGFSGLLTAYFVYWAVVRSRMVPPGPFLGPVLVGAVVGAVLLAVWLKSRRALARREAGTRWILAAGVSAAALACPLWFIATVR